MYKKDSDLNLDVVLVSDAKSTNFESLTKNAIESIGSNANIIVIESNKNVSYSNTLTIHPNEDFNYNRYLNIGAAHGSAEYIFFGNNDIVFSIGWDLKLITEMKRQNIISASPLCPKIGKIIHISPNSGSFFGYELISRFCGWAFVWTRSFYDKVGGLDEDFTFWCSDNASIEQLLKYNERHALVTSSIVEHFGLTTLNTINFNLRKKYTIDEVELFNKKFNKNLWDSPHFKLFE